MDDRDEEWKDQRNTMMSRLAELVERFVRPMVERAERQEQEDKDRREAAKLAGEEEPPFPGLFAIGIGPLRRPLFCIGITTVVCDDGAVMNWNNATAGWDEAAPVPGTARAVELATPEPPAVL